MKRSARSLRGSDAEPLSLLLLMAEDTAVGGGLCKLVESDDHGWSGMYWKRVSVTLCSSVGRVPSAR